MKAELEDIKKVSSNELVNIIVFQDLGNDNSSKIFYIENGDAKIVRDYKVNIDSGNFNTLIDFFSYASKNYPAKKYVLNISSHCSVSLELKAGVIRVDINFKEDGHHEIVMYQKSPIFMNTYDPDEVMPLFGLTKDDVLDGALIQTVSTGTPQLMIPVKNLEALKKSELNVAKYREFKARGDFSSPHLFCLSGVTSKGDTFARHFGLPPDTFEDPFTGSSTGNMACYLWKYNLIENPVFFAEQGHWMGRPGIAKVEVLGPRDDIETVKVIGNAVTSIKGELIL